MRQTPCSQFLPPSSNTKIKLNEAACHDAFEAEHAFPTESYPAAALSEMSNANKDEELFIFFIPPPFPFNRETLLAALPSELWEKDSKSVPLQNNLTVFYFSVRMLRI